MFNDVVHLKRLQDAPKWSLRTVFPLYPVRVGVGGMELVPQAHGGALMRGGTPEGHAKGGRVAAERRRARAERSEAVDDAMVGHVEKMSKIIAQLVEEAGGGAVPMSAVRQFPAEGERPLKVPSPPAPTAVFTGVRGRAGQSQLRFHLK